MAATLEIKYYNSFWLKKIKDITNQGSEDDPASSYTVNNQAGATITLN